jgi:hypothetical protein
MPKLTDTQLVILAAAAKRDNGSILPLPKKLKLDAGGTEPLLKALIRRKLVAEQTAIGAAATWRESIDRQPMMLVITQAGLRAIGAEAGPTEEAKAEDAAGRPAKAPKNRRASARKPRPSQQGKERQARAVDRRAGAASPEARAGSKQGKVVELLRRPHGASIAEMMKATGWQTHSVRGVISGALKKKLGLAVTSEKTESGERRYHIGR